MASTRLCLGLSLALLVPTVRAAAQSGERSAVIVLLKGSDTVLVERIQRSATTVTAEVIGRGMPRITLVSTLAPNHLVASATFLVHGAGSSSESAPLQRGEIRFEGDTAHVVIRQGATARPMAVPTKREALLLLNNDFVVMEQAIRRAQAARLPRWQQPLFALTGGATLDATVELFAPDSARFTVAGNVTVASVNAAGNITGGYLPGQGIQLRVVEGPAAAAVAFGRPNYAAPEGAPYVATEVVVPTPAGHPLAGTLTIPAGATGRLPAIITITGSGQQDRDEMIPIVPGYRLFRQVADTLSRRGIAVLRLDDRGVGGSGGDVNGTSADFADDIRAAIAYLRTRAEIDGDRIGLVGHSEGGLIAPMIAATDPKLAAIVLMAGPSRRGDRVIDYQLRQAVRSDPRIAPARFDSAFAAVRAAFDSTSAKAPWMRFFLDYDPLPTLARVTQPVLILQGATDRQVTADQAAEIERALRAAGNRTVSTKVFADRNHLFLPDPDGAPTGYAKLPSGRVDGEVMGALADWLVATLRAR
jgi:dienelactone hydrolase